MTQHQYTVGEWRSRARSVLASSGDLDAEWDADWMICEALKCERSALRWLEAEKFAPEAIEQLEKWLSEREEGKPLQYIVGSTCFMGLDFRCDVRALIPRQDTETLVELALERIRTVRRPKVLDLCAGTGAIGLSVLHFCPEAEVTLADISEDALSLTRENARALGLSATLRQGDLWEAVKNETFDFVLSNPPYLTDQDMDDLMREVRYEPQLALRGGADGLSFYRRIADGLEKALREGGEAFLEVGCGQSSDVAILLKAQGFMVETHKDLCGVERVIHAWRRRK